MRPTDLLLRSAAGDLTGLAQAGSETWSGLVELAAYEGMEGLLYYHCAAGGMEIPGAHLTQLQSSYRRVAEHNCIAGATLAPLLEAMATAGLDVLILPGASLLPLYPDPGCRPMDDVDLLVPADQLSAAAAFFRARGYEQPRRHQGLFRSADLTVDLHTDLVNGSRIQARRRAVPIDASEVWQRAERQSWPDAGALTLSVEDALVYTALHALRHSFKRLTWFIDFQLLAKACPEWDMVRSNALQYNALKPITHCLHYIEDHLSPVSSAGYPALSTIVGFPTVADLPALGAAETFLLRRLSATRPHSELGEILWSFSCRGIVERASFLLEFLFPRPDVMMQVFPRLPRALMPLAYGLRAIQLLLRGSRQLGVLAKSA